MDFETTIVEIYSFVKCISDHKGRVRKAQFFSVDYITQLCLEKEISMC